MEADCQAYVLAKERTSGTMCTTSAAPAATQSSQFALHHIITH